MIISDTHKFVFIHIPKCAGTSVRKALLPFDEKTIKSGREKHPIFGLFDYNHIPLSTLRNFFPEEYKKVRTYHSFSIVRDPFARFSSSLGQRMKSHKKRKLSQMTSKEVKKEVDQTIKLLLKHKNAEILPAELIHFQKQKSYIYDGESVLIDSIYHVGQLKRLFVDLEKKMHIGLNFRSAYKQFNKSKPVYRNELLRQLDQKTVLTRRMLMSYIPKYPKQVLKSMFKIHPKKLHVFQSDYVVDFIHEFYHEDIALHNRLAEREQLQ